jgi:hypothetical protein
MYEWHYWLRWQNNLAGQPRLTRHLFPVGAAAGLAARNTLSDMSALHLKADMCSALAHVCFGPIADIPHV